MNFECNSLFIKLIENNPSSRPFLLNTLNQMKDGVERNLGPCFYIHPLDTGFGKSTLIKIFLAEWKAEGFKGGEGVLIALNTKEEIEHFSASCGLDATDYAALTADESTNSIGLGAEQAGRAPVLFTTQSMLRKRLARKGFTVAHEFFYKGKPRALRIWDERCNRGEPIHLSRDGLLSLLNPVRRHCPEWAEGVENFADQIKAADAGSVLPVPTQFGSSRQFVPVDGVAPVLSKEALDVYKQLKAAAGKRLRVCAGKLYGNTLIGAGDPLPADLAPMLVLDASARLVDTYALWAKTANVVIEPALVRDYRNLTVRIWKTASGNTALEDAATRGRLLGGVAKTLNLDPQPTLLVGSKGKAGLYDLADELAKLLDNPDELSFRHWGRHYGTNEFARCKRMVVVNAFRNRDTVNQAIYMAASGVDPTTVEGNEWIATGVAEMKQNLLQAFRRGSLRTGTNGECGEAVVYFAVSGSPDPKAMVHAAFPGCTVEDWEPYGTILQGQAKAVFDVLAEMAHIGKVASVTKREVRMLASITSSSRFSQLLSTCSLHNALKEIGITTDHKHFHFAPKSSALSYIADARRRWLARRLEFSLAA